MLNVEPQSAPVTRPAGNNSCPRHGPLHACRIDGVAAFLRLEADWRAIVAAAPGDNPFLHWEWVAAWVRHYGGDELLTVIVSRGDQIVAIAPFYRRRYRLGPGLRATALQLYGPREQQHIFELREVPALPGYEVAAYRAILAHLATERGWDWLEVAGYEQSLAAWDTVIATCPESMSAIEGAPEPVPILKLQACWEAQRRGLKRNGRESIRRCYNRLARNGHDFAYVCHGEPAAHEAALADFFTLHRQRARLRGTTFHLDQFKAERERAFLADATRAMMAAGQLKFGSIVVDGATVASRIFMVKGNARYCYFSGFDPAWWHYGVMTLLDTEGIKQAIALNGEHVNFSPGIDQSKARWGCATHWRRHYILVRRSGLSRGKLRLLHWRKQLSCRLKFAGRYLFSRLGKRPAIIGGTGAPLGGVRHGGTG